MNALSSTVDRNTVQAGSVFVDALTERFDAVEAHLFGSRARGTHASDSDVDIAVVLNGSRGDLLATKLAMADIAFDAVLETGLLFEPLPIWSDEWARPETHSNPRLLKKMAREGVRL